MVDLSIIPFLSDLSDAEKEETLSLMTEVTLPAGELVLEEGERSQTFYLLVEGKVDVFVSNEKGETFTLNTLEGGSYFGELAFLDEEVRAASVSTLAECRFLKIEKDDFRKILTKYPAIYETIVRNLVGLMRLQTNTVRHLAMRDSYSKLNGVLNEMKIEPGNFRAAPTAITAEELADKIGAPKEIVVRLISILEQEHYLTVNNGAIFVHRTLPQELEI